MEWMETDIEPNRTQLPSFNDNTKMYDETKLFEDDH